MKEETFGPIVGIMPYNNLDEAIDLANDSNYGLTASIWTNNNNNAKFIANKIKAGVITINDHLMSHGMPETPWGGFKESGFGRTHGKLGFNEMVQNQLIVFDLLKFLPKNFWWFPYSKKVYDGLKGIILFLKDNKISIKLNGLIKFISIFFRVFEK